MEEQPGRTPDDGLRVYPNPAKGIFNISLRDAGSGQIELRVYNINGQLVRETSLKCLPGEFSTQLDLTSSPEGMYHLRLIDGDRVIHRKIIRE